MIKSISYWSIEGGLAGTRPVEEAITEAAAAGFAGLELAIAETGVFTPATDEAACQAFRRTAEAKGVTLQTLASGMSWGCSPTSPDPAVRHKAIELHQAALHRAAWLGARSLLFVPGAVKIPWDASYGPVRYDDAVKWAREAVATLSKTAEQTGVTLCIENVWNGLFYSPLEVAAFVDSFGSDRVGIYFDAGNVLGYQQHPPHWVEILGERIRQVHVKDFKSSVGGMAGFCELLDGDVPFAQTMKSLRTIGYDGTVVAEMIPPAPGLLQRTSKAMDQILAMQ